MTGRIQLKQLSEMHAQLVADNEILVEDHQALKLQTNEQCEVIKDQMAEIAALKARIENYQKHSTRMERALSDYYLLKNVFSELVFSNRTAKDGQVWKFNSNEGQGEWC